MTGKGMDEELTLPDNATCANVNGRPTALAEGKVGCSRPFQLRESCIVVADRVNELFMDWHRACFAFSSQPTIYLSIIPGETLGTVDSRHASMHSIIALLSFL